MSKHCDQCKQELVIGTNCLTRWAKRCCNLNNDELSECQKSKNKETAKASRKKRTEEDKQEQYNIFKKSKYSNINEADRVCLRCDEVFSSKGVHNRICDRCNRIHEGIDVSNLSRAGDKTKDINFYWD